MTLVDAIFWWTGAALCVSVGVALAGTALVYVTLFITRDVRKELFANLEAWRVVRERIRARED